MVVLCLTGVGSDPQDRRVHLWFAGPIRTSQHVVSHHEVVTECPVVELLSAFVEVGCESRDE